MITTIESENKQNQSAFLKTLLQPFDGCASGIPDFNPTKCILKSLVDTRVFTPTTLRDHLFVNFPYSDDPRTRFYLRTNSGTFKLVGLVDMEQKLWTNFDRFRMVSRAMVLTSTAVSGGQFPITGVVSGACFFDPPSFKDLADANQLVAPSFDGKSRFVNQSLADGGVVMNPLLAEFEYRKPYDSTSGTLGTSNRDGVETTFRTNISTVNVTSATQILHTVTPPIKNNFGRHKIKFFVTPTSATNQPLPLKVIFKFLRSDAVGADADFSYERSNVQYYVTNSEQILELDYESEYELDSIYLVNMAGGIPNGTTILVNALYSNSTLAAMGNSEPAMALMMTGHSLTQQIAYNGVTNIEAAPNTELVKNLNLSGSVKLFNPDELQVVEAYMCNAHHWGLCRAYPMSVYTSLQASLSSESQYPTMIGRVADWWDIGKKAWQAVRPFVKLGIPLAARGIGAIGTAFTGVPMTGIAGSIGDVLAAHVSDRPVHHGYHASCTDDKPAEQTQEEWPAFEPVVTVPVKLTLWQGSKKQWKEYVKDLNTKPRTTLGPDFKASCSDRRAAIEVSENDDWDTVQEEDGEEEPEHPPPTHNLVPIRLMAGPMVAPGKNIGPLTLLAAGNQAKGVKQNYYNNSHLLCIEQGKEVHKYCDKVRFPVVFKNPTTGRSLVEISAVCITMQPMEGYDPITGRYVLLEYVSPVDEHLIKIDSRIDPEYHALCAMAVEFRQAALDYKGALYVSIEVASTLEGHSYSAALECLASFTPDLYVMTGSAKYGCGDVSLKVQATFKAKSKIFVLMSKEQVDSDSTKSLLKTITNKSLNAWSVAQMSYRVPVENDVMYYASTIPAMTFFIKFAAVTPQLAQGKGVKSTKQGAVELDYKKEASGESNYSTLFSKVRREGSTKVDTYIMQIGEAIRLIKNLHHDPIAKQATKDLELALEPLATKLQWGLDHGFSRDHYVYRGISDTINSLVTATENKAAKLAKAQVPPTKPKSVFDSFNSEDIHVAARAVEPQKKKSTARERSKLALSLFTEE